MICRCTCFLIFSKVFSDDYFSQKDKELSRKNLLSPWVQSKNCERAYEDRKTILEIQYAHSSLPPKFGRRVLLFNIWKGAISFSSENHVFNTIGILSFFFFCLFNIHAFHNQQNYSCMYFTSYQKVIYYEISEIMNIIINDVYLHLYFIKNFK